LASILFLSENKWVVDPWLLAWYNIVPHVEDEAKQKWHYEQAERMLLASFTSGLLDQAGKYTRFNLPENMDQALKIATTVNQAEIQERRNETFHVEEARESRASDRTSGGAPSSCNVRSTTQHAGASRTKCQNRKGPPSNSGNSDNLKYYECGGVGHFVRECPTRKSRLNSSKPTGVEGRNVSQGFAGNSSQDVLRRLKGRKNDATARKSVRKGSSFHISVPENVESHFTARMQPIASAPTIKAKISGNYSVFVLDKGSGISLIQPGVYSSEVNPNNVSPFGVTGKELEIQGIQEVTFHLNGRKFSYQFCVCSLPTEADGIIGMDYLAEKNADLNLKKNTADIVDSC
jgi:hypothetical protein